MVRVFANRRETWFQSQVESYQRLKKWYFMPSCSTLSIIRYGPMVKWSNPGKGLAPFTTPWCSSYRKGSLRDTLEYGRQFYVTLDFNETLGKKTRWELYKDSSSCFQQILEIVPYKTALVRLLTSNLTHHLNKTCKTCWELLKNSGKTHKRRSSMDSYTWTHQCWPISKNLQSSRRLNNVYNNDR